MAKLDMRSYPELSRLMSRRERERNNVRGRRSLGDGRGEDILEFWEELAERIQQEEDLDNMESILFELRSDIDMLKALQMTLMVSKDDSDHKGQLVALMRLIHLLLDYYEKFKRWHWHLRDRALAYYLAVNPAMPSRAREKYESEKDDKKAGQEKAKRAVDEAHKPKGKGPKGRPRQPTKKMEA